MIYTAPRIMFWMFFGPCKMASSRKASAISGPKNSMYYPFLLSSMHPTQGLPTPIFTTRVQRVTRLCGATSPEPVYTCVYSKRNVHMHCQKKVSILFILVLITSNCVGSSIFPTGRELCIGNAGFPHLYQPTPSCSFWTFFLRRSSQYTVICYMSISYL